MKLLNHFLIKKLQLFGPPPTKQFFDLDSYNHDSGSIDRIIPWIYGGELLPDGQSLFFEYGGNEYIGLATDMDDTDSVVINGVQYITPIKFNGLSIAGLKAISITEIDKVIRVKDAIKFKIETKYFNFHNGSILK